MSLANLSVFFHQIAVVIDRFCQRKRGEFLLSRSAFRCPASDFSSPPAFPDRVGHPALPVRVVGNAVPAAEAGGGGAVASASCRPVLPRVCGLHLAVVRLCLLASSFP